MGPHSEERGNPLMKSYQMSYLMASMGPHSEERGNMRQWALIVSPATRRQGGRLKANSVYEDGKE
jgi:hypothetical protein